MTNETLLTWGDTPTSDRQYIELIGLKECSIAAEAFICVEDAAFLYFCKIEERPNHFSPTLGREDAASLSAMYKKLGGDIKLMAMEQYSLLHYKARLIGRKNMETHEHSEALTGPSLGILGRRASDFEVCEFLGLPTMTPALRIGRLFNSEIPVCVSQAIFRHHLLIAGTTGQGKTTLITNIVAAAYDLHATIFLMDFKPDYQRIEETTSWRDTPILPEYISYWNLNEKKGYRGDTKSINVHFSELNPELYMQNAANQTSDVQYDVFMQLYDRFAEMRVARGDSVWTCQEFYDALPKNEKDSPRLTTFFPDGDIPHKATLGATYRIKKEKPKWVDVVKREQGLLVATSRQSSFFEEPYFLQEQRLHVIQANIQRDKHYGLFMATLMQKILDHKEEAKLKHPILIVLDEAQDIFNTSDFAKRCIGEIASVIRKGRSQNIGVVVAVQSADSVPSLIANCLNSTIAFRHNSDEAAGFVRKQLGTSAAHLQELDRGNAVIKLFGAKSVVRTILDREAFELVKDE